VLLILTNCLLSVKLLLINSRGIPLTPYNDNFECSIEWSIISNAFEKSMNTPIEINLLSIDLEISSTTFTIAINFDDFS